MDKRILVLGAGMRTKATLRFLEEAEATGIDLDVVSYRDILFQYDGSRLEIVTCDTPRNLFDYSHFICRASMGFSPIMYAILTAIGDSRIVLNREVYQGYIGYYNKLVQLVRLAAAGLPLIPTRLTASPAEFHALVADRLEDAPSVFLKRITGSHGDGAEVVECVDDLGVRTDREVARTLLQDNLPAALDYRVLVLGDRTLGAMRRTKAEGSIVSNVAKGGAVSPAELGPDLQQLALRAARVMKLEFAGVDLLMHDGSPYILEVNEMPEFAGFEQSTGVNVAGEVLSYLLSK